MGNRRLKRFKNKNSKKTKRFPFVTLVLFVLAFLLILFFLTRTRYWDGKSKLSVVIGGESVQVVTFDPSLDQITTIKIPENTQVEVARNLGTWKIGSVWKLGQGENLDGRLLQETIVKNFGFPVPAWSSESGVGLSGGNIKNLFSSVFSLYKTNLTMGDKLRIFLFSMGVDEANKNNIDLSQTQILKKTKLVDGEAGYDITKATPTEFIGLFSNSEVSNGLFTVSLNDSSEEGNISGDVSSTIEYLGAKVVSKSTNKLEDMDCDVTSDNKKFGLLVSQIFGCKLVNHAPDGNFDLELKFGKGFAERF